MKLIHRLPLAALLPFALLGCDVFDESLIKDPDPVVPQGQPELLVGDKLDPSLPANLSYTTGYHTPINFADYEDSSHFLPTCLDNAEAPGADVFFKVDMKAGEKWHFHVLSDEAVPLSDPAVYVLNDWADPDRACTSPLAGINACGAKAAEHFSFLAAETKSYYVGVDGMNDVNESLKIVAVHPECGNGFREHSEYCDPSAAMDQGPLDDCEGCRKVLEDGGDDGESSVNDGPLDATTLKLPGSRDFTFAVHGQINTGCDFDFFTFTLDNSARVTAKLDSEDFTCDGVDLQFWDDDGETNPFTFTEDTAQDCMEKSMELTSGTHWVRVGGRPSHAAERPAYRIDLRFAPL